MRPRVLILHATGTNRDREAALASQLAGGAPEIVHVNQLVAGDRRLADFQMLVLPGGFSYGDDLGAGKLWAVALRHRLGDDLEAFVAAGKPVLGICNGFQALVKSGLLPGLIDEHRTMKEDPRSADSSFAIHHSSFIVPQWPFVRPATLTRNDSARFECRWVYLAAQAASPCVFTQDMEEPIYCPVAHGEGKFVARNESTLAAIETQGLVALRYVDHRGEPGGYPWNPNGSQANIAGVCNPQGTILGLMPHPEDHVLPQQHPHHHRGRRGMLGLPLFANGVRHAGRI